MSLATLIRNGRILRTVLPRASQCLYTTEQGGGAGSKPPIVREPAPPARPATPTPPATTPEPFDNTHYSCGVYYQHDNYSFYDYDISMKPSRVGQPSSVGHYNKLPQDVLAELEKVAKK